MSGNPIPGTYGGRLIDWFSGRKGSKNTQVISLDFAVTHRLTGVDPKGKEIWSPIQEIKRTVDLWLSPAAKQFSLKKLASLGFNGIFENKEMDFSDRPKKGQKLVCKLEVYEGQTRDKWDLFGFGTQERTAMSAVEAQLLASEFRASGFSTAPAPSAPPDDEIPF